MVRENFTMFKNWVDTIKCLPTAELQAEVYNALAEFSFTGEIPDDISPVAKAILQSFSISVEKGIAKHKAQVENGKKKKANGSQDEPNETEEENEIDEEDEDNNIQIMRKRKILLETLENNHFWGGLKLGEFDFEKIKDISMVLCEILSESEIRELTAPDLWGLKSKWAHYKNAKNPKMYLLKCYKEIRGEIK